MHFSHLFLDGFRYFLSRDLQVLKCNFQWQLLFLRNETYHSCRNRRHLCLQDIGNIEGIAADTWRPGRRKSTLDFISVGCLSSSISWFLEKLMWYMKTCIYKIPGECHVFFPPFSNLTCNNVFLHISEVANVPLQLGCVCILIISAWQFFEINCLKLLWMEINLETDNIILL